MYLVKGVGKIILAAANGSTFTLFMFYMFHNLLSILALAKNGLVVKFVDDRCTVHDLRDGNVIVAFGSLCHGDMVMSLPNLKALEKHVCEGCILGKMA